jgi:hypothetical protein
MDVDVEDEPQNFEQGISGLLRASDPARRDRQIELRQVSGSSSG